MTIVALVTARSGSKSVVDKNIREIGGKSLLEWSVRAGLEASLISQVFISTDSEKYAEIAKNCGATVPFIRPTGFATDTATDSDVFSHFISNLDIGGSLSGIVHLRPTSPFRDPKIINQAIEFYQERRADITSLRSVQEMPESAYKSFELDREGFLRPLLTTGTMEIANLPRQSFPKTYAANGYVDVIDPRRFAASNSLHGGRVLAFSSPSIVEVDSGRDLELLDYELQSNPSIFARIFGGENV